MSRLKWIVRSLNCHQLDLWRGTKLTFVWHGYTCYFLPFATITTVTQLPITKQSIRYESSFIGIWIAPLTDWQRHWQIWHVYRPLPMDRDSSWDYPCLDGLPSSRGRRRLWIGSMMMLWGEGGCILTSLAETGDQRWSYSIESRGVEAAGGVGCDAFLFPHIQGIYSIKSYFYLSFEFEGREKR